MSTLRTKRLQLFETAYVRETLVGKMKCVNVTGVLLVDPIPCFITVAALLCEIGDGHWALQHIMVEEEERRKGFAGEFVRFYEERLGWLGGAFASDSGEAFAKAYTRKYGARPHWQIGTSAAVMEVFDAARKERTDLASPLPTFEREGRFPLPSAGPDAGEAKG